MKKTTKKLQLNQQTVRQLSANTLGRAVGGAALMSGTCTTAVSVCPCTTTAPTCTTSDPCAY